MMNMQHFISSSYRNENYSRVVIVMKSYDCGMMCAVTFDDDEPNSSSARLTLTVKEMTVKKPLFGAARPENAEITSSFDNG